MKEVATLAANLMAASARTAPKAGGKDFLEIVVITDEGDLNRIAQTMQDYAPRSTNEAFWLRDADNIEHSEAVVLTRNSRRSGSRRTRKWATRDRIASCA